MFFTPLCATGRLTASLSVLVTTVTANTYRNTDARVRPAGLNDPLPGLGPVPSANDPFTEEERAAARK
jgi:hypothetical protein